MIAQTLSFGVAILLVTIVNAEYNVEDYCQLVPPGTKLASHTSCQIYYTCTGNNIAVHSSCPDSYVFDKDAQSCVPQSDSNCYVGLSNPCRYKDHQFAWCSKGCNWYNYCLNGEIAGNATCEIGERFYPANGTCVFGACDNSGQKGIVDLCSIMPDGVYFGDFENCHEWHKCSALHEEHGACENNMVFDVTSGWCLPNNGQMCQRTHNAVQSEPSGPPQVSCETVNEILGDTNVCSVYYTCQANNEWKQLRCNSYEYFDVISQKCIYYSLAKVYPGCDRCEFSPAHTPTYWVNAVDPNCQQYLTCTKGRRENTNIHSCEGDYFFDESAQYCIEGETRLDQYEIFNGACQDYSCNDFRMCSMDN